jgi:hypothetical protein
MKALDMFSNKPKFIHVHRKFNCGYVTHFFLMRVKTF